MFRHCVMIRWSEDSTTDQQIAARDAVAALPGLIPEIQNYSVGFDAKLADNNHDMVVIGDFNSAEDYSVYAKHPDHVQVFTDYLKPILAERSAVQYEL